MLTRKKIAIIAILIILLFLFVYWEPVSEFVGLSDNNSNGSGSGGAGDEDGDGDEGSDWEVVATYTGDGILSYGETDVWDFSMSGYESGATRTEVEYEWSWAETCEEWGGEVEFCLEDSTDTVRWGKSDTEPTSTYGNPEIVPGMIWDGVNQWQMYVGNWASCKMAYKWRVVVYALEG